MLKNNNALNEKVFNITQNYRPDLVLFGNNNILSTNTIEKIKSNGKTKIALWYEDHLIKGGPNYINNLDLIEKNRDLIDQYFVTTFPDLINTKIAKNKLNYIL